MIPIKAISLGCDCTTEFQIRRHNRISRALEDDGTHIFDWQITPLSAVIAYIERDFTGIFEREDLVILPHRVAYNRRFSVEHTHAFQPQYALTEADIDAQYAVARSKIDYLAEKFRRLLDKERGPLLYIAHVVGYVPHSDEVGSLLAALRNRAPRQRFHIAFVGRSDKPFRDLSPRLRTQVNAQEGSNFVLTVRT
jgi:hypothetical protein